MRSSTLSLLLAGCFGGDGPVVPEATPGTVRIVHTTHQEGELEPCG